jgi:large subunit ribosomal protein L18
MITRYKPNIRRQKRVRAKIKRQGSLTRLSVFRSNKYIYAQLLDNKTGKVLVASSDLKITDKKTKTEKAGMVGKDIAEKAMEKGIKQSVFDRGSYQYHGRVKALCEAAREAKFVI